MKNQSLSNTGFSYKNIEESYLVALFFVLSRMADLFYRNVKTCFNTILLMLIRLFLWIERPLDCSILNLKKDV